ncbi:MAG TPA: hypothetical protein VFB16_02405 [Bauldia sp.]|nr:hypothetical protein [Bauldia sp.]
MSRRHLVATGLVAITSVMLTAEPGAQAAKDDNRFQQSAEARRQQICAELKSSYDFNMNYYKGNPSKRGRWKIAAENLKTLAEGNNCSWAQ